MTWSQRGGRERGRSAVLQLPCTLRLVRIVFICICLCVCFFVCLTVCLSLAVSLFKSGSQSNVNVCSLAHPFIESFIHLCLHTQHSFIYIFLQSLIHSIIHLFIHSLSCWYFWLFICSGVTAIAFVCVCVCVIVCLSVYLLEHPALLLFREEGQLLSDAYPKASCPLKIDV